MCVARVTERWREWGGGLAAATANAPAIAPDSLNLRDILGCPPDEQRHPAAAARGLADRCFDVQAAVRRRVVAVQLAARETGCESPRGRSCGARNAARALPCPDHVTRAAAQNGRRPPAGEELCGVRDLRVVRIGGPPVGAVDASRYARPTAPLVAGWLGPTPWAAHRCSVTCAAAEDGRPNSPQCTYRAHVTSPGRVRDGVRAGGFVWQPGGDRVGTALANFFDGLFAFGPRGGGDARVDGRSPVIHPAAAASW